MTGNLILNADPTSNLGAATKQYVDGVKPKLIFNGSMSSSGVTQVTSQEEADKHFLYFGTMYVIAGGTATVYTGNSTRGNLIFYNNGNGNERYCPIFFMNFPAENVHVGFCAVTYQNSVNTYGFHTSVKSKINVQLYKDASFQSRLTLYAI